MAKNKPRHLYTGKRYMGRKITTCGFLVADPWATSNADRVTCKRCLKAVEQGKECDDG